MPKPAATATWSLFTAEPQPCEECGAQVNARVRIGHGYPSVWGPWLCPECGRKARGRRLPAEFDGL